VQLAHQLKNLGTETVFAVSAAASAHAAAGHKVYPFHLGDLNLPTPANIVAAAERAMAQGHTGYCPPNGIAALREALAAHLGAARGVDYGADNVSVQPGGKPVIPKFLQAVMNPGDEVLYPHPGFPIYESQIGFQGGVPVAYRYVEAADGKFVLDLDALKNSITRRTRILIYNNYHNPTGAAATPAEMAELAELAVTHNLWVLADEAYFDIQYGGTPRSIVSLAGMPERTVILYTYSKRFAMTGWRVGAAIGPASIIAIFDKLNVNSESCTNHFVQHAALEALQGGDAGAWQILAELRRRRDAAVAGLNAIDGIAVTPPDSAFYLYPKVSAILERKGLTDVNQLMERALQQADVSFCTSKHYGPDLPGPADPHIRLAFSGLDLPDIEAGLARLKVFFES